MKIDVHGWHTNGYPTNEEMEKLCRIGQGEDTCVWLVAGPNGFECTYNNKSGYLLQQWEKGLTVAKRDGCFFMKNLGIVGMGIGEHEIDPFEE